MIGDESGSGAVTIRKRWPNEAEWARMDCISLATKTRKEILDAIDRVDNPTTLKTLFRAIEALREIEEKLKEARGE